MAKRKQKNGYSGVLAEPIRLADPHKYQRYFDARGPFLITSASRRAEAYRIKTGTEEKLPALFAHFEISMDDPDCWQRLAIALARQHVPGFGTVHDKGAPIKETVWLCCQFYRYFIRTKATRNRQINSRVVSDADVCRALSKDATFKEAFPELAAASSKRLQNLLSTAKSMRRERIAEVLRSVAYTRTVGPDYESGYMWGDMPSWISDRPSPFFLKFGNGGPPEEEE